MEVYEAWWPEMEEEEGLEIDCLVLLQRLYSTNTSSGGRLTGSEFAEGKEGAGILSAEN